MGREVTVGGRGGGGWVEVEEEREVAIAQEVCLEYLMVEAVRH